MMIPESLSEWLGLIGGTLLGIALSHIFTHFICRWKVEVWFDCETGKIKFF